MFKNVDWKKVIAKVIEIAKVVLPLILAGSAGGAVSSYCTHEIVKASIRAEVQAAKADVKAALTGQK